MAIEAREYTEKDELIGQFYALRAGLSAIAQETQEIHEIEHSIQETNDTVFGTNRWVDFIDADGSKDRFWDNTPGLVDREKEKNKEVESAKKTFDWANEKLQSVQSSVDYERKMRDSYIEVDAKKRYRSELKEHKVGVDTDDIGGLIKIIIIYYIGVLFLSAVMDMEGMRDVLTNNLSIILLAVIPSIILFIGTIIVMVRGRNSKIWYLERRYREEDKWVNTYMQDVDERQKDVNYYKQELSQKQSELTEITTKKKQLLNELQVLENKRDTQVLPERTSNVKQIKAAMHQQFDHLITEADWQNVDLLIFYLETGRADSLKEALLLVDQQRQTDQIVKAVGLAAQHVASAVHTASLRLGEALYSGFRDLGARIDQNHREILSSIDQHNATMADLGQSIGNLTRQVQAQGEALSKQTQSLIDAERLNGALLEKANQNSDELMRELRYNQKYWVK